ncbi:single-stranded-DNA-specific exonuclease RecJ [Pseudahrensia aquimaris]|uniref:Single-stranded-DNA-specific exonuclease RecJ n=1 Tax=Pseudahrensia aquimaris TaxID=744461 RepID=A0ABW3FAV5_9HYPH
MSEKRPFLEVDKSITGQRWMERLTPAERNRAEAMAERFEIDSLVARVLAGRGVELEDVTDFLNPTLRSLMPDPATLTAMDAAAGRLADAVEKRERVAIFGDYDVDGATSSALMALFLKHFSVPYEIYIPDRIFEGYGPNGPAIEELHEKGATLLVTVDCGSTSHEALAKAAELGMDTIILDHHQVGETLPQALALVNPNRQDDLSGQGHLCAAGVVFLALVALNRELKNRGHYSSSIVSPDLMGWLDLVALGTVCDVVPLKGLNRAFVMRGLDVMHQQRNPGLVALARAARQDGPAAPWHLGFLLGPRINAGGRIGDAALGARLLTSDDPAEAKEIAQQLDALNGERQRIEKEMLEQAINEADAEIGTGDGPAILITESETWHPGVVGLLASRLKDRFRRPAFAIAFDGRGQGAGSGRSIAGVDLGSAVRAAVDEGILEKGGGHVMAAGVTIKREKLADFRSFMEERLAKVVSTQRELTDLRIDGALSARGASVEFMERMEKAGPFGAGHSQPVLAFPNHVIRFADVVGAGHVRFSLGSPDGAELKGIAFRRADDELGQALLNGRGQVFHFVGTLNTDFYRGTKRVQLRLIDAAKPAARI